MNVLHLLVVWWYKLSEIVLFRVSACFLPWLHITFLFGRDRRGRGHLPES